LREPPAVEKKYFIIIIKKICRHLHK